MKFKNVTSFLVTDKGVKIVRKKSISNGTAISGTQEGRVVKVHRILASAELIPQTGRVYMPNVPLTSKSFIPLYKGAP